MYKVIGIEKSLLKRENGILLLIEADENVSLYDISYKSKKVFANMSMFFYL